MVAHDTTQLVSEGPGCPIWPKRGLNWPQMEQIRDFFQIRFQYILALVRQNVRKYDLKKDPDLSHLGLIGPNLEPNLTPPSGHSTLSPLTLVSLSSGSLDTRMSE